MWNCGFIPIRLIFHLNLNLQVVAVHPDGYSIGPPQVCILYSKTMKFALKNDDICITHDELCILNDEFCILNDEFCILNDEFCILNDEFCILNDRFCRSSRRSIRTSGDGSYSHVVRHCCRVAAAPAAKGKDRFVVRCSSRALGRPQGGGRPDTLGEFLFRNDGFCV